MGVHILNFVNIDGASLHRYVPDECVFIFQDACVLLCCNS